MVPVTFSEKEWDKVRPASVKKTGISEAMRAFLKAAPAGRFDGIKTADGCVKALAALAMLLEKLVKAQPLVAAAKDDSKDAAAKLKKWVTEVRAMRDDLAAHQAGLNGASSDTVVHAALTKWSPVLKKLESQAQDLMDGFKKCEGNQGQAEGIAEQAVMGMVQRAGELKASGHAGTAPMDFMDDRDFKSMHVAWSEQNAKWAKAAAVFETLVDESRKLWAPIDELKQAVEAAVAKAGVAIDSDAAAMKSLKKLAADVHVFHRETRTDQAKAYYPIRFFPTTTPSNEYVAEQERSLAKRFGSLKKVDADSFFEEGMAKYGFDRKQLQRAVATAKKGIEAIEGWRDDAMAMFALPPSAADANDAARSLVDVVKKMQAQQVDLKALDDKYKRGRRNQELANQLAAKVNADYAKTVETAMKFIASAAERADAAVAEVTRSRRTSIAAKEAPPTRSRGGSL